jgi:hypothetical protein
LTPAESKQSGDLKGQRDLRTRIAYLFSPIMAVAAQLHFQITFAAPKVFLTQ